MKNVTIIGGGINGHNIITIDPEDDPYAYGFQVL